MSSSPNILGGMTSCDKSRKPGTVKTQHKKKKKAPVEKPNQDQVK